MELDSPFKAECPACGADGDDPEVEILLMDAVEGPAMEHFLQVMRCDRCGVSSDIAVLVGALPEELRALLREGANPASVALLDRHLASRAAFQEQALAAIATEDAGADPMQPEVDLPDVDLAPLAEAVATRPVAVPARALAAARGVRAAAETMAAGGWPLTLRLGSWTCVVSIDVVEPAGRDRDRGRQLHISLSDRFDGFLSKGARYIALSLFFTSDEMACLVAKPGTTRPVEHYYLAIPEGAE